MLTTSIYKFAYGLIIESQIDLPELPAAPHSQKAIVPDVRILVEKIGPEHLVDGRQFDPWLWVGNQKLFLQIPDVGRFLIRHGREILIDPAPGVDQDGFRLYLLGSALGAILFQRGFLVLHGNAVQVGNDCLVCIGESGAGKSTTAAAFFLKGHKLLSDDVVAVDALGYASPGFPRIKLWKNAADILGLDTSSLRRVRTDMEKFDVPVSNSFSDAPSAVRWIYLLELHDGADIRLEPIKGAERFSVLHAHTYRVNFMSGMELHSNHLRLCAQLSSNIRLVRVLRPRVDCDPNVLTQAILDDVTAIALPVH